MFAAALLAVASRSPVGPTSTTVSSESSTATAFERPTVLTSARSVIVPAGSMEASVAMPNAPTNTEFGATAVTDGAVIVVELVLFLAAAASTGESVSTPS